MKIQEFKDIGNRLKIQSNIHIRIIFPDIVVNSECGAHTIPIRTYMSGKTYRFFPARISSSFFIRFLLYIFGHFINHFDIWIPYSMDWSNTNLISGVLRRFTDFARLLRINPSAERSPAIVSCCDFSSPAH